MKTKEKVRFWLEKHEHLRDDDNRLCANIWNEELKEFINLDSANVRDFLRLYSFGKLTPAPTIKRIRAKLQSENPQYRGENYYKRKGIYEKDWRNKLGYEKRK